MLHGEALRQVGKLIADCDRRLLLYALTEEYLDALARAAATAVKGAVAEDHAMLGGGTRRRLDGAEPDPSLEGSVWAGIVVKGQSGRAPRSRRPGRSPP